MAGPPVEADDPVVADLLAAVLDLVLEAGGWIHPAARLVARAGQLSLACDGPDDAPLVQVPRAAFVRVDDVTWDDADQRLDILEIPDRIGGVELEMLYLQTALLNQCARIPWITRTHPALASDIDDQVIAAVRRVVPGFRAQPMRPVDVLFATRCFRIPLDDPDSPAPRVLVPVVDLLNHHRGGASGSWDGRSFQVSTRRPFGTSECALDYGMDRDALQMAVVYGFADASADVAHGDPAQISATLADLVAACASPGAGPATATLLAAARIQAAVSSGSGPSGR